MDMLDTGYWISWIGSIGSKKIFSTTYPNNNKQ